MRNILIAFTGFILFTSCLKKIEEVDQLNTNVFDKEYAGEQWFEMIDVGYFENSQGMLKIKVEALIKSSTIAGFHPSSIQLHAIVNNQNIGVVIANQHYSGDYPVIVEAAIDGSQTYCLTLGIYDPIEGEAYNEFTDCLSL